jgi:integral membrane protein (TIGR01906 family)
VSAADVASDVAAGAPLLAWARGAVSVAFVLALPFVIIGSSLRWLVTDRDLLLRGFEENQVARTTRLDEPQLRMIADAFVAYFQAPPGRLDIQVRLDGQSRPLFNEREILHMEDVQRLVQWFLTMQVVGGAVVALRLLVALAVERSGHDLGRDLLLSAGLLVSVVVVVGALSAINFTWLWLQFHRLAFRNDLWMLDPRSDHLIMLFPQPFWLVCTLRMAGAVAAGTVLAAAAGFLAWRAGR